MTGDSKALLPDLVKKFNETGDAPNFILLDADHSTDAVRTDIESLLLLKPRGNVVILLHDSFNPDCRRGMTTAKWESSPHVHSVEIDFVPGIFHARAFDTAAPRSMWAGLACAIMKPEHRHRELIVQECQKELFEAVRAVSVHAGVTPPPPRPALPPLPVRVSPPHQNGWRGRWRRRMLGKPIP